MPGYPFALALGDVDGDGKLDLVVSQNAGGIFSLAVLPGNGDGTFRPYNQYTDFFGPSSLALADLDGDGSLDVVHVITMDRPESVRDELLERLAIRFRFRATEDPFCSIIEQHDLLRFVCGDDGVHGRIDDARKAGFSLPEFLLCTFLF